MSIHGLIDTLAVGLGAKFMPKYFRESAESETLAENLQKINLEFPTIKGEGDYEVTADTLVGELNAGFRLVQWMGDDFPTVIYHHGASEIPFDYGFKGIFPLSKMKIHANLFLIRAPFHGSMKEFQWGIRSLANVVAMLSVSACLIEHLVSYCREKNISQILAAGTSLGGFITNIHHIHYNSADVYTPLLAGLAMDDAYLFSAYSRAVDAYAKEKSADHIKAVLNFEEDFLSRENSNVFPLLARFDRLIRYQRQKDSYGKLPVAVINKGHTTGALAYSELRRHILKHLDS